MPKPKTVLGIPGTWESRDEITSAIAERSDGYVLVDGVLLDRATNEGFDVQILEPNSDLRDAFQLASRGALSFEALEAIDRHTFTIYLVASGGTTEHAKTLLHVANGLLRAGGLAVIVESAGIAHSPAAWLDFCLKTKLEDLLAAYVTFYGADGVFFSCGMHNLGLPDAFVEADLSPDDATELLHMFCGHLLLDEPKLDDGHTFSVDEKSKHYRLDKDPCTQFEPDDLYHNPFGVWRITRKAKRGA